MTFDFGNLSCEIIVLELGLLHLARFWRVLASGVDQQSSILACWSYSFLVMAANSSVLWSSSQRRPVTAAFLSAYRFVEPIPEHIVRPFLKMTSHVYIMASTSSLMTSIFGLSRILYIGLILTSLHFHWNFSFGSPYRADSLLN